jgi:hypothetical protein
MPAFFIFAPGAIAIEWEWRLHFLFFLGTRINRAANFRAKCSKIAQILQIFPILLTV